MKVKVLPAIGLALAAMQWPPPHRRRVIGNGTTDIAVTPPNPALPGQVCTTHIEGFAGLSTTADPAVTPPPPGPYSPQVVELFAAPSLDGYSGGPSGQLLPPDPSLPIVNAIASVTAAAPTALNPPEQYTATGARTSGSTRPLRSRSTCLRRHRRRRRGRAPGG